MVLVFKELRAKLEGSAKLIKVLSDYKNFKYFINTK